MIGFGVFIGYWWYSVLYWIGLGIVDLKLGDYVDMELGYLVVEGFDIEFFSFGYGL